MCGFFGQISLNGINLSNVCKIAKHLTQRASGSSGFIYCDNMKYKINISNANITRLSANKFLSNSSMLFGYSNSFEDNISSDPIMCSDQICAIYDSNIVNKDEIFAEESDMDYLCKTDSDTISYIVQKHIANGGLVDEIPDTILKKVKGVMSCALLFIEFGNIILFSNNGSLYIGSIGDDIYFSSEQYPLVSIGCDKIEQIKNNFKVFDIPISSFKFDIEDNRNKNKDLSLRFSYNKSESRLLEFRNPNLKRCTKCVLPETMPFIQFDEDGVCNYCKSYKIRNKPKPKEDLIKLIEPYRKSGNKLDCIVPFSGGRDSCYGLHLVVNELKMKPIAYTYDWGVVTDLGKRNISRMCSSLGVENIVISADIAKKRKNVEMNLKAWLKSPHLGMMALLTAGDKHFFRYIDLIKKQTGIKLNLWGVNPLEVTHFKTGFLGLSPDFKEQRVYSHGLIKQINYHTKRFMVMLKNLDYFNSSLWDTLSGEYYRSFTKKEDYYHIFDYWRWDENTVNSVLLNQYDWETAIDTSTTWRIGDGTAAFYNYVYHTVAGFTEHDTFRSNQIREGQISREKAIGLINDENRPRYENIKWYLDILGMDFQEVIKKINNIPKMY